MAQSIDDQLMVSGLHVTEGTLLGAGGTTRQVTRFSFMLGKHGPFFAEVPEGAEEQTYIPEFIAQKKNVLRNIMAVHPGA